MSRQMLRKIDKEALVLSSILLSGTIYFLATGSMYLYEKRVGFSWLSKDQNPSEFWLVIFVITQAALYLLIYALRRLLPKGLHHIFELADSGQLTITQVALLLCLAAIFLVGGLYIIIVFGGS